MQQQHEQGSEKGIESRLIVAITFDTLNTLLLEYINREPGRRVLHSTRVPRQHVRVGM